jgi:hypothetical protein
MKVKTRPEGGAQRHGAAVPEAERSGVEGISEVDQIDRGLRNGSPNSAIAVVPRRQ